MTYHPGDTVEWRSPRGWITARVVKEHWQGVAIRLPGNGLLILAQPKNLRRFRLASVGAA